MRRCAERERHACHTYLRHDDEGHIQSNRHPDMLLGHSGDAVVCADNDHHIIGLVGGEAVDRRSKVSLVARQIDERHDFCRLRGVSSRLLMTLSREAQPLCVEAHVLIFRDRGGTARLGLVLVPEDSASCEASSIVEEAHRPRHHADERRLACVDIALTRDPEVEVVALARRLRTR